MKALLVLLTGLFYNGVCGGNLVTFERDVIDGSGSGNRSVVCGSGSGNRADLGAGGSGRSVAA